MKTVSALDLRKKLGSVLNNVSERKEAVTITRSNRVLAVIISPEEYEDKVQKSDRGRKLKELSSRMDSWKRAHRKEAGGFDAAKAIRDLRAGK